MRRFWCTSCFVGERLSDALLFASSNLTNTNSRADIKDICRWSWTSIHAFRISGCSRSSKYNEARNNAHD